MSSVNTNQSSEQAIGPNAVRKLLLNSRRALDNTVSGDIIRVRYRVRVEAPLDALWAFAAITDSGRKYKLEHSTHDTITFSSGSSIWMIRRLWNKANKDLHVMIETLNFVNDYTGERYFRKYWDANTEEKKDDLAYYNSDNSDSEEEPDCKYCQSNPSEEGHDEDCEIVEQADRRLECNKKFHG